MLSLTGDKCISIGFRIKSEIFLFEMFEILDPINKYELHTAPTLLLAYNSTLFKSIKQFNQGRFLKPIIIDNNIDI